MPVKLEIRWMRSSDVNDLSSWNPASFEDIFYPLEIDIGQNGDNGTNVFDVLIASPEGLRKHWIEYKKIDRPFPERNVMVFGDYSWGLVQERIRRIVESCARETWQESVSCLNRYFRWEYEDYHINPPC